MKKCIVILGMHRSGTSAFTGSLNLLGIRLGSKLMPSQPDNPKGFFENQSVVDINEKVLEKLGSSWDDMFFLPDGWLYRPELISIKGEIDSFLQEEWDETTLFAIKDPRLCRLLPLWLEAFERLHISPHFVIVFRNPLEVTHSLQKRNSFSTEKSVLLWMQHMLLAELHSRQFPRSFIDFNELLENPQATIAWSLTRADFELIEIDTQQLKQLEFFLDSSLRHYRATPEHLDELWNLAQKFYSLLQNFAHSDSFASEYLGQADAIRKDFFDLHALFFNQDLFHYFQQQKTEYSKTLEKNKQIEIDRIQNSSADELKLYKQEAEQKIANLSADNVKLKQVTVQLQNEKLHLKNLMELTAGKPIENADIYSQELLLASIVIPVFNQVDYTRQCLEALSIHTPENIYEIIIIDNNSTDGTKEYLRKISGNVRIISNEENFGFTIACNQGAQEATGEYIVFLNNDTIPLDGWLTALLDTFKLNDDIGAVGSKLIYPDLKLQEAGGIIFSDGNGWNFGKGDLADHGRYNQLIEVDYCSAASLAVRRDIFNLVGGFDEIYAPAYYEDTDLCFSIREKGYRVFYQPQSEVIHCEGKTAGTNTNIGFKKYQLINKEKFKEKWQHRLKDQGPSPYENAPKPFTADRNRRLAGYTHATVINNFEEAPPFSINGEINFLIIDPFLPIYDRASGSFRLFQIVKILAKTPQVHVTYIARQGHHGEKYIKELKALGVEVYCDDMEKLFSFNVLGYRHLINLKYILSQRHYHYAFLSFYEIAIQYLPDIRLYSPETRIIIDTVDIHFLREMRQADLYQDEKIRQKALNTRKNETNIYQKADALITVTEQDADIIRPYFGDRPIYVIPNIHPLGQGKKSFNNRSGIIFIGNYYHPPNIDAVEYYLQGIHPRLQQKKISIPVSIIGDGLPDRVKSLAKGLKNITFTGWVPETKPYLERARISIAPLRYGAGMKGKIGEALAAGLPIVTTTIGAEGMGLTNNQEVLITDSADEFADMIATLYRDAELWEKLSMNGMQFIEQRYSPATVAEKISKIFRLPNAGALQFSQISTDNKEFRLTSIIIVCFNQLEYTKKCLQSIENYTMVPYELILVDNGSTDGTKEFLEEYVKKHTECHAIYNEDNLGFAGGNNLGISIAKGDYILLLNNDVIVTKNWLTRLIELIDSEENIGMIGPVSNAVSGPQQVDKIAYGQNLTKMHKFAQNQRKNNAGKTQDILRLVGFCLLIKREVLDIIGTLDESYGNGNYEDDDLCLRSRIAGFRNIIAHEVFIHHYGSMTFRGNSIDYTASLLTNKKRFFEKWEGIVESIDDATYRVNITAEVQEKKLLEWGEMQFNEGNLRSAVKIFGRVLSLDPVNSQAINNIGVIQWQLGDPAAAIRMFKTALINNPHDANAIENLIQAVLATGKTDLIEPGLREILKKAQPENTTLGALFNSQQI